MTDYGFKIADAGGDVKTEDDELLYFSSKFHSLKIYQTGTLEVTTNGSGNGTTDATHGLSFAPAFKAYVVGGSNYYQEPGSCNSTFGQYFDNIHVYTDTTKIYLQVASGQASTTYTAKYMIFGDLAQTFTSTSITLPEDYGLKVSKAGEDVKEAELYNLTFTSSLKNIKFDPAKVGSFTMSLSGINCDASPNTQSTATNVAHGLGYPPFYLAWFKTTNSSVYFVANTDRITIPWFVASSTTDAPIWELSSYCNATNVTFTFAREASCVSSGMPPPIGSDCDIECVNWGAETVTVYYYIFREDVSSL